MNKKSKQIKLYLHDSLGFISSLPTMEPDKDIAALKATNRVLQVDDNRDQSWIAIHFL